LPVYNTSLPVYNASLPTYNASLPLYNASFHWLCKQKQALNICKLEMNKLDRATKTVKSPKSTHHHHQRV
jgi:hypothetical protein